MKPAAPAKRTSIARRLGDILLTSLAVAGSVCMIMVILGVFFNVSIMMFRTGSMSPTITSGSIALVHEIPATEIHTGDIVTVDRGDDLLPVTHRVTAIQETSSDGTVVFTMRGDGNETPDPEPYRAQHVQRVFFSVPGMAPVIQWFNNPVVLAGTTVAASLLVVWAFWPRSDENEPGQGQRMLVLPFVLVLAGTATMQLGPTGDDLLQLRVAGDTHAMANLEPGQTAIWTVDAWADTQDPGQVTLRLSADRPSGGQGDALRFSVVTCPVGAHDPLERGCPPGSSVALENVSGKQLADDGSTQLEVFPGNERRRIVVSGTLSEPETSAVTTLRLTANGFGTESSISPDRPPPTPQLPLTGSPALGWAVASAAILVGAGTLALRARRNHRA